MFDDYVLPCCRVAAAACLILSAQAVSALTVYSTSGAEAVDIVFISTSINTSTYQAGGTLVARGRSTGSTHVCLLPSELGVDFVKAYQAGNVSPAGTLTCQPTQTVYTP